MSWIRRRPYLALGLLAFGLRAAGAIVTEYKPVFPAYYYTDANLTDFYARQALEEIQNGKSPVIDGALGSRLQTLMTLGVYRALGPKPLAIKLVNALFGALGVAALAWALTAVFSQEAALLAGALVALWPSHAFYTSQNLKEAPANLLAYAALGSALHATLDARATRARTAALVLGMALALLGVGVYRSYVMVCLAGALLLTLGLESLGKGRRARALGVWVAVAAVLPLYPTVSRGLHSSFVSKPLGPTDVSRAEPRLIPVTYNNADPRIVDRPTSPAGITGFRKTRQSADLTWAKMYAHREIGTQIYPDAEFKTWTGVFLYLPKGAFTVLFMPLPGLYPMAGKIGRWAAASENLILLTLAALAVMGFARGPKTPGRLGLLAFFAVMTAGAALLEFDLGSAGRHKLLYLPMLFPFAAEEALRLLGREESE